MLEEALQDPSKNPAEVAQAMLNFVRSDLPSGGTSSEERFFRLFSLLCARIFGQVQGAKDQFKHPPEGWLSAQTRWRLPPNRSSTQRQIFQRTAVGGTGVAPSTDITMDPVVQLLGPTQQAPTDDLNAIENNHLRSLIEAITVEVESRPFLRYPFPFPALPEYLQQQFMLVLEATLVGATNNNMNPRHQHQHMAMTVDHNNQQAVMSQNSYKLFASLLKVRPEAQNQVRAYQQIKLQGQNSTQTLQLSPGLSPKSMATSSPTMGMAKPTENENVPNLILSMLEYYMFLFIRFPLACTFVPRQVQAPSQMGSFTHRRQESSYGEQIYIVLFRRYLRYFLPHTNLPTYEANFPPAKNASEFFLRVVIAFWLESHEDISPTAKATQAIRGRFQRTGSLDTPTPDLNMSYDLSFGKYMPPPSLTQKCLRELVIHLMKDPTIKFSVMDRDSGARQWCLSQATTTLQRPFYNYVRSAFRCGSIHAQDSPFYTAMNSWLLWLEPWNVNPGKFFFRLVIY